MLKWTWYVECDDKCWDCAYDTPEEAIKEMSRRMGEPADEGLIEKIGRIGIYLAQVRVAIVPVRTLRPLVAAKP